MPIQLCPSNDGETSALTPSFEELGYAVLKSNLGLLINSGLLIRESESSEVLHDMRVATRHLRVGIRLFAKALPESVWTVRPELGWMIRTMGKVRDIEVQLDGLRALFSGKIVWLEHLENPSIYNELKAVLEQERTVLRCSLLESLGSERWSNVIQRFLGVIEAGPMSQNGYSTQPALVVIPSLITASQHALVAAREKALSSKVVKDFHQLRIKCKYLRYSLEFVDGLYGSCVGQVEDHLTKLQDRLGRIQDAHVGLSRLVSLGTRPDTRPDTRLSPSTTFVMGCLAEHYRVEIKHHMDKVPKLARYIDGKDWHRFSQMMDAKANEAAIVTSYG